MRLGYYPIMHRDYLKTLSFLALHLIVGFSVAYLFTGSLALAGGIALVEPLVNAVVFFFHERAWQKKERPRSARCRAAPPWHGRSLSAGVTAAVSLVLPTWPYARQSPRRYRQCAAARVYPSSAP